MEVVQDDKASVADEILAPDVVLHANGQEIRGLEGAKQLAAAIHTAFPDVRINHQEAVVSGDRVAILWTSDGTHRGDYYGVPPTGKRTHIEGLDLFHVRDNKITEAWIEFDNLGLLQQIGAVPAPGKA
jgi:steroid delta-isomerase-like uncharacterized protein